MKKHVKRKGRKKGKKRREGRKRGFGNHEIKSLIQPGNQTLLDCPEISHFLYEGPHWIEARMVLGLKFV